MRRLALCAALLLCGCRSLPFPEPQYEGAYGKALKKWTRSAALYSGLETRAFVRVVYHSDEFVTAQAAELSRLRAERPDRALETLRKLREQHHPPTVFAVVYVPDRNANDWSDRDSVWRLALNLGLGEQAPVKVERFERPFNAELRVLYPYLDEYSVAYRIVFPEPEVPAVSCAAAGQAGFPTRDHPHFHPTDAEMVVAGALGSMTFHWALDGRDESAPAKTQGGPPDQPPVSPKP